MSLTKVRPYFRTRLNGLGFKEWKDAFNFENIPSTILDKAYHIETGPCRINNNNQQSLDLEQEVTIRFFRKGYLTPADGIDLAVQNSEDIIKDCLNVVNRLTTEGIKTVYFRDSSMQAISASNDNLVMTTINFGVLIILSVQ